MIQGTPVAAVLDRLLVHVFEQGSEGVTISGGEPMQQAEDLTVLLRGLRTAAANISIGMFTGYSPSELAEGTIWTRGQSGQAKRIELWHSVRACLDFAVMGRYNRLQPLKAPLRSSRNQELRIFTGRYTESDFRRTGRGDRDLR
jgi:anaerobic ribonucleoside-triphosphate reductase activating protein